MRDAQHDFNVVLGRNTQPARVMRLGRFDTLMAMHYINSDGPLNLTSTPV